MKIPSHLVLGGTALLVVCFTACSGVEQIGESELTDFSTLDVKYGHPGPSPDPCDDALPQIDGTLEDLEWRAAVPLLVRMTGDNGNGGATFNLEVRAVWTDESRLGGMDRIYFLINYPDDDINDKADLMAYVRPRSIGTYCPDLPDAPGYCVSPPPMKTGGSCDPDFLTADRWERLNPDGQEDQVMIVLTDISGDDAPPDLPDAGGALLGVVGPEIVTTSGIMPVGSLLDVWIWRAGRTNLQRVPQYADWDRIDPATGIPDVVYSRFIQTCGFMEDAWVDDHGTLRSDGEASDLKPFVKNFARRDPVPDRLNQCQDGGRDDGGGETAPINGGLPSDLAMWWGDSQAFGVCDTNACTRIGKPFKWSTRLLPGDFDIVHGWGLQVPSGSNRDVRARGSYAVTQEKGYGVRTIEIMREMDTQNPDDVRIQALVPDPQHPGGLVPVPRGRYRMTIGVLDNSGEVGSGSATIYLNFEPPQPWTGTVNRCQ